MTGALLSLIGYTNVTAFEPEVTERIFKLSCIAPLVGFGMVGVFLIVFYPLDKRRVEANVAELARRRGE